MIRSLVFLSASALAFVAALFGSAFSVRERSDVDTNDAEAAFIVPSATAPVEHVIACEADGWSKKLATVQKLGAERLFSVPDFDAEGRATGARFAPWPTDDWVIGFRGSRRAVLELPGRGRLADWGNAFFNDKGWECVAIGKTRDVQSLGRFDKGGNILASPPLAGFPNGRLVVGRSLQNDIKVFFQQQAVQAGPDGKLIEIDTDWLKVGHVDEVLAFVRAPGRPGFRVVLPDFEAGLRLLASAPAERAVFYERGSAELAGSVIDAGARFLETTANFPAGKWRYVRIISGTGAGQVARIRKVEGRLITIDRVWDLRSAEATQAIRAAREGCCETMPIWFDTPDSTSRFLAVENSKMWRDGIGDEFPAFIAAGELANDPALRKTVKVCSDRLRAKDSGLLGMLEAFGIRPDEALRIPVLFSSDEYGMQAAALTPNPINLVSLDERALLLRPFGPRGNPADDDSDLFAAAWCAALKRGSVCPALLDGWNALHRADGGAHCGTNAIRKKS